MDEKIKEILDDYGIVISDNEEQPKPSKPVNQ